MRKPAQMTSTTSSVNRHFSLRHNFLRKNDLLLCVRYLCKHVFDFVRKFTTYGMNAELEVRFLILF